MDQTYVPLFRKLKDWEWYRDSNTLHIFIHCLLKAQYMPTKYQGKDVPAGSFVAGYSALAEQTGMSMQNVRTAVKHLESTGEISRKVTNKFSVISVTKWDTYKIQNSAPNNQLTNNQQTTNKQLTPSKEGKKARRKEQPTITASRFDMFWSSYPKKKNKGTAEKTWDKNHLGNGSFDAIMKGLENAKASEDWLKDGGQYIPHPSTWLNAKGWEDEYNVGSEQPRGRNLL